MGVMPKLKKYRGFISHAWEYNESYYRLEKRLKEYPNFDWENYSVPEHDAIDSTTDKELEKALRNQIRPTNHVLILAGMYVAHSHWIQTEIDIAQEMSKPIIGIRPWGSQRTPKAVQDAAVVMVGWNTPTIVAAIREHSK